MSLSGPALGILGLLGLSPQAGASRLLQQLYQAPRWTILQYLPPQQSALRLEWPRHLDLQAPGLLLLLLPLQVVEVEDREQHSMDNAVEVAGRKYKKFLINPNSIPTIVIPQAEIYSPLGLLGIFGVLTIAQWANDLHSRYLQSEQCMV